MMFYTHWFNRMFHGDEASSNVSPKVAGNFATEMYGAKKSSFWLSMSFDQDMVRVDPYWFAHNYDWNDRRKREYFTNFWEALLGIDDKSVCTGANISPHLVRRLRTARPSTWST